MVTSSFLERYNQRVESFRFGKDIKFNVKSKPLTYFRITYSNPNCHIKDGVGIETGSLEQFKDEMYKQLSMAGYVIDPCKGVFCENCAYIYLNERDKQKEYPRFKVYVHPNELSGWAPNIHVKKLQKIAEEHSQTSNVKLVFSQKVYNISDEEYLKILKEAEPQIQDWLMEYIKHCGRRRTVSPGKIFDEIFGLKRPSTIYQSSDYVVSKYINSMF